MHDSIIKGTGNSRYMKSSIPEDITHEELVALLRTGTFPFDLNGINEDGFERVGDALNKATLLKDATAISYELNDNAVPDDAFRRALGLVGDTRTTIKTNLDTSWLLCNGEMVYKNLYPDLVDLLKNVNGEISESWSNNVIGSHSSTSSSDIYDIAYHDGTYVAISGSMVAYSSAVNGTWKYIVVKDTENNVGLNMTKIIYENGYWIICATAASSKFPYIIYTDDPKKENWVVKRISTSLQISGMTGFVYGNGAFVISGYQNGTGYPFVIYAYQIDGEWTEKILAQVSRQLYCSVFHNNIFVLAGSHSYCFYASNPAGPWTEKQLVGANRNIYGFCIADNKLVAAMSYFDGTNQIPSIAYADSVAETWTEKNLSASKFAIPYGVLFHDGLFYVAAIGVSSDNYLYLFYSETLEGEWSYQKLSSSASRVNQLKTLTDIAIICGNFGTSNIIYKFDADFWAKLPTISMDGVYTYIKGRL